MELIRGKTFIKSYAQNSQEKLPPTRGKDKKNAEPEQNINECQIKKNIIRTQRMSNSIYTNETSDKIRYSKLVKSRSKTYDCALKDAKPEKNIRQSAECKLPSSLSSPCLAEEPINKRNNAHDTGQPTCKQTMIDYRNFVPQRPFVPSVAKSLPRKRISLRRSKNSLKNLFNLKRYKQQDVISEEEKPQPAILKLMKEGQPVQKERQLDSSEMSSDDFLTPDFCDREMYIEATDPFKALCEDVTSLKSFDSLTGCGEIFADECSSFIDIENNRVMFISKPSLVAASFQGGVERLASPAKSESVDVSRLRGHVRSLETNLCTNVHSEAKTLPVTNDINNKKPNDNMSCEEVSNLPFHDLMASNETINDAESPLSTSDEGYYESYSPGLEEDKKAVHRFPRDSYSGDALYELFWDSSNTKTWSADDCGLTVSSHNTNTSKSMYSFCEGSEENLISEPAIDVEEDNTLQNTWKGRECFLKLCDTELSLTIGMVNWLKKTGTIIDSEINDHTYSSKVTAEESQVSNGKSSTAIETTITVFRDNKDQTSTWESNINKIESIGDHIKDSKNSKIQSNSNTEEPETSARSFNHVMPGNNYPFKVYLGNSVLNEKPPNPNTFCSAINNNHEIGLFSPHSNIVPVTVPNKLNKTRILPLYHHLDSLQALGQRYLSWCISENNSCMVKILEESAAQIASFYITFGNQSILHNTCKIMRPYEITQNIKNVISQHYKGDQEASQKALPSASDTKVNNKQPRTAKNSNYEHILPQYSFKNPKEIQTSNVIGRPSFQTIFKSPCSTVISRCSSVLYRVLNLEDEIIFFNRRKCQQSLSNNYDPTQNLNMSSIDFSKYRKSISPTGCIEERGLLITKNKKWSMDILLEKEADEATC